MHTITSMVDLDAIELTLVLNYPNETKHRLILHLKEGCDPGASAAMVFTSLSSRELVKIVEFINKHLLEVEYTLYEAKIQPSQPNMESSS